MKAAAEALKSFVAALPKRPGVYRMLGAERRAAVRRQGAQPARTASAATSTRAGWTRRIHALVSQIAGIEVTVTGSETEALLLEYNLIKAHRPRFNVMLRDDKSFPYIYLHDTHEFPRLVVLSRRAQPARALLRAVSRAPAP